MRQPFLIAESDWLIASVLPELPVLPVLLAGRPGQRPELLQVQPEPQRALLEPLQVLLPEPQLLLSSARLSWWRVRPVPRAFRRPCPGYRRPS